MLIPPVEPEQLQVDSTPYDLLRVHAQNALAWKQLRQQIKALITWAQDNE
jgi:hypothetical protein